MPRQRWVLRGGMVADGADAAPRMNDVAIDDGRITVVPSGTPLDGDEVDCRGRVVAPGFIDIHTHSDLTLLEYPSAASRITQGITTEVMGNCGMSAAPTGGDPDGLAAVISTIDVSPGSPRPWDTMSAWFDHLDDTATATHSAALIGHGTARFVAAGADGENLSSGQMRTLERVLDAGLDAGAVGVSLGLMYSPGEATSREELDMVATVVARRGALLAVHLRDYSDEGLAPALEEVIGVARRTGVRLQISHLRAVGPHARLSHALALVDHARSDVDIAADSYPYTAGHTTALQLFPADLRSRSVAHMVDAARESPARLTAFIQQSGFAPDGITVMKAVGRDDAVGLTLPDLGANPWRALVDLIVACAGRVDVAVEGSSNDDVLLGYQYDWMSVASDGAALASTHAASRPHPRSWGTFPAAYRLMRDHGFGIGEAVRRCTSLPASRVGLRAVIHDGAPADLVVFDDHAIDARADYVSPAAASTGIDQVFVAGERVLSDGIATNARPGRHVRRALRSPHGGNP